MRTLISVWAFAFILYLITPYAIAMESKESTMQTVWTGYHVVGDVCFNVRDKKTGKSQKAQMWLINNGETRIHAEAKGLTCLEVNLGSKNEIRVELPNEYTEAYVVRDDTSPFFTVELPF